LCWMIRPGEGGQSWIRTRTRAAYHCAGCVCCHQLAKVSNSIVPICLHGNSVGSLRSRCLLHTANIPEQVPVSVDGWYSPKQLMPHLPFGPALPASRISRPPDRKRARKPRSRAEYAPLRNPGRPRSRSLNLCRHCNGRVRDEPQAELAIRESHQCVPDTQSGPPLPSFDLERQPLVLHRLIPVLFPDTVSDLLQHAVAVINRDFELYGASAGIDLVGFF
jgi:hypothetical protein